MKKNFISIQQLKSKLERYCSYQDRCHKEIEKKIQQYNIIQQTKEQLITHLIENNFLNEERYAKSFARGKFRIKKWGKLKIIQELKKREISLFIITIALKEIDENDYLTSLYEIAKKKNKTITEKNIFKRKNKLINFLKYYGYEYDLIYNVVSKMVI